MKRVIRIILYQFSHKKNLLDFYMRMIRKGNQLSESQVEKLKDLISNEKSMYN